MLLAVGLTKSVKKAIHTEHTTANKGQNAEVKWCFDKKAASQIRIQLPSLVIDEKEQVVFDEEKGQAKQILCFVLELSIRCYLKEKVVGISPSDL